jgi:hypothetical protein
MIELHDRAKFEANSRSPKEENRINVFALISPLETPECLQATIAPLQHSYEIMTLFEP